MAPKKRSRNENPTPVTSTRVTRSSSSSTSSNATVSSKTTAPSPAKKKAKTQVNKAAKVVVEKPSDAHSKTVVIEHCKQCNQFKTRAMKVKDALENDISGINVVVNPEKPRRGCFEVREEGGEIFISLLDMKRPFKPMRELDMDKEISDILEKLK